MPADNRSHKLRTAIIIVVPTSILLVFIDSTFFQLRKRIKSSQTDISSKGDGNIGLPTFDVVTIAKATNNFSSSNKIGEGGFGPVFKGQLSTGQLMAVKRNSEKSNQGLREFKNEVILIAKLQHAPESC
ncbi:cysteine-rich receptor-like protein kinase 11 [Rhododendron vialii]|uniref:cysteine-rich receptor-like protein kinase 11 n=1 Tax=Rhododendron vialii TaxID=182163 RepID=UPI00265F99CD|nr:cysteine-rich receptor-like protein kinase 11 [Rhododendron vialii]